MRTKKEIRKFLKQNLSFDIESKGGPPGHRYRNIGCSLGEGFIFTHWDLLELIKTVSEYGNKTINEVVLELERDMDR